MDNRTEFRIVARPGAVGLIVPADFKKNDMIRLGSPDELRGLVHSILECAHRAWPDDFEQVDNPTGVVLRGRGGLSN